MVGEVAGRRWRIYDVPDRTPALVEELAGNGESNGTATAVALDYLRQHDRSR